MSVKTTKDGFFKINNSTTDLYYKFTHEESASDKAEYLTPKQKDVLKALGEYKQEVLQYANQHSIDCNSAANIKKLFDYYNFMQE